mgnify:FL=1
MAGLVNGRGVAPATPQKHELEFRPERETKNTFRYAEVAGEGGEVVGYIYLQKTAITGRYPLKVTIEEVNGQ